VSHEPLAARWWSAFVAIVLAVVAGGCGSSQPHSEVAPKPFAGVRVEVGCLPGAPSALIDRYSRVWAKRTGGHVVVSDSIEGADVLIITPADLGRLASTLVPVPETVTDPSGSFIWRDVLLYVRNPLLVWDGHVMAWPLLGDGRVCFYRRDLLTDAELAAEFKKKHGRELAPPATWQDYAALAEFFKDRKWPGHTVAGPSLPPLPESDDELDREFYSVAAPMVRRAWREDHTRRPPDSDVYSFHFDGKTGQPRIAEPGFVAALELLRRLQACRPSGTVPDPAATFFKGDAVVCCGHPSWIRRFQAADSPVRGRVGVIRVPGSEVLIAPNGTKEPIAGGNYMPYLASTGWIAVVPRTAQQPAAAVDLLSELGGPAVSRQILVDVAWGGGAFRREHFDIQTGWDAFGLEPQGTAALRESMRQWVANPQVINPVLRLRTPNQRAYQKELIDRIRLSLGGTPADQSLQEVTSAWNLLAAGRDAKDVRAEQRLSVGLQP
jgi:multiple sugar transport system substrate-binding protein